MKHKILAILLSIGLLAPTSKGATLTGTNTVPLGSSLIVNGAFSGVPTSGILDMNAMTVFLKNGIQVGGNSLTLGGALTTSGAFPLVLTLAGNTNATLPAGTTILLNTTGNGSGLTGLTSSQVGLGNVDNTSDATKNAASVSLTNHTIVLESNTVTMQHAGSGSVARNVQDEIKESYVNVRDYGVSIGNADNAPYFQAAADTGRSVYIPEGKTATVQISTVAATNPCSITTTTAHGFTSGQTVRIYGTSSVIFASGDVVNGNSFTATVTDATHFTIAENCTTPGTGGSCYTFANYRIASPITIRGCGQTWWGEDQHACIEQTSANTSILTTASSAGENFIGGVGNNDCILFHGLQLKGHSASDTSGYAIDVSPATSSDWITIEHCFAWNIWTGYHVNTIGKMTLLDDAVGNAVNGYIFEGAGNNASQALGISSYNCSGIGLWFKSGAFAWTINAGDFVGNAINVKNDGGIGIVINTMNEESYTSYGVWQTAGDMTLDCVESQGTATGVAGRLDGGSVFKLRGTATGWKVTSTSARLNVFEGDVSGQLNNGDATDTTYLHAYNSQFTSGIPFGTMRPASGAGGYTFALGNRGRIIDFVGDGTHADSVGRVIKQASTVSSAISAVVKPSGTATISNANPAVVTWTGSNLTAGTVVQFTTTGTLPSPLTVGTFYYVIAAGLGANTFEISTTSGGSAIITTTAGSGTHTAISVTCTVTVASTSGITTGNTVTISGTASTTNDGEFFVTVTDGTHFTYTNSSGVANASESGTAYLDRFIFDTWSNQILLDGANTWSSTQAFNGNLTIGGTVTSTGFNSITVSSGSIAPLTLRQNGGFRSLELLNSSGAEMAYINNVGTAVMNKFFCSVGGSAGSGAFYNNDFAVYSAGTSTLGLAAGGTAVLSSTSTAMSILVPITLSSTLNIGTTHQGDVLYDNGTSIVRLTPGTSGQFLKTNGASANVTWANIAAGIGSPVVQAKNLVLAASATTASVTTFTTPNDSTVHPFRVGATASVTAISAGTLTFTATFTDQNNSAQTVTFYGMGLTSAGITATGYTGFAPAEIWCKPNTAITIVATFAGVSITYDAGGVIESLY